MKKNFRTYALIWAILFAVFNVICFVTPSEAAGINNYSGAFWVGYIFITIAFIGNLICTYSAFSAENNRKLFYNLPLITISYSALTAMFVVGTLVMAIPNLPNWIGIIACVLILAFNAIAIVKANWAADAVSGTDASIEQQTSFIRSETVNAENLYRNAKNNEIKLECKRVYDALRYSDPMSNSELAATEGRIAIKMTELAASIGNSDAAGAKAAADKIIALVEERNGKCKLLK